MAVALTADDIQQRRCTMERNVRMRAWLVALSAACVCGLAETAVYTVRANTSPVAVAPEKINPNTASVESLMRLDSIGPSRASAIVEYRGSVPAGEPAFVVPEDLEKVKGIGAVTVGKIRDQLCFE